MDTYHHNQSFITLFSPRSLSLWWLFINYNYCFCFYSVKTRLQWTQFLIKKGWDNSQLMLSGKFTKLMSWKISSTKPAKEVYLCTFKKKYDNLWLFSFISNKKCVKLRKNRLGKMFFAFSRFLVLWRCIQKFFVLNDLIYKIFFFVRKSVSRCSAWRCSFIQLSLFFF